MAYGMFRSKEISSFVNTYSMNTALQIIKTHFYNQQHNRHVNYKMSKKNNFALVSKPNCSH